MVRIPNPGTGTGNLEPEEPRLGATRQGDEDPRGRTMRTPHVHVFVILIPASTVPAGGASRPRSRKGRTTHEGRAHLLHVLSCLSRTSAEGAQSKLRLRGSSCSIEPPKYRQIVTDPFSLEAGLQSAAARHVAVPSSLQREPSKQREEHVCDPVAHAPKLQVGRQISG